MGAFFSGRFPILLPRPGAPATIHFRSGNGHRFRYFHTDCHFDVLCRPLWTDHLYRTAEDPRDEYSQSAGSFRAEDSDDLLPGVFPLDWPGFSDRDSGFVFPDAGVADEFCLSR